MSRDWEAQLGEWAKPPGKTEADRCDNAVSAFRNATRASQKLQARGISIFAHGSYRNKTNVRKDSDVDSGILCTDTFFYDLPEGTTRDTLKIIPATYEYEQFKNENVAAMQADAICWKAVSDCTVLTRKAEGNHNFAGRED